MTHAEFVRRRRGYERRVELDFHRSRIIIQHLLAPHITKGSVPTLEQIIPLKMDKRKKANLFDAETMEMLKRFMNNKK